MWGKRRHHKIRTAKIDTLVGKSTTITGDVSFTGGLHVEGTINGNVLAADDRSILVLSEHGVINGEVHVPFMMLNGQVEGDVHSSEKVELVAKARINGSVYYNLIEMAVGASVNGSLVHHIGNTDDTLQLAYQQPEDDETEVISRSPRQRMEDEQKEEEAVIETEESPKESEKAASKPKTSRKKTRGAKANLEENEATEDLAEAEQASTVVEDNAEETKAENKEATPEPIAAETEKAVVKKKVRRRWSRRKTDADKEADKQEADSRDSAAS